MFVLGRLFGERRGNAGDVAGQRDQNRLFIPVAPSS
jgi:hypothetical protein